MKPLSANRARSKKLDLSTLNINSGGLPQSFPSPRGQSEPVLQPGGFEVGEDIQASACPLSKPFTAYWRVLLATDLVTFRKLPKLDLPWICPTNRAPQLEQRFLHTGAHRYQLTKTMHTFVCTVTRQVRVEGWGWRELLSEKVQGKRNLPPN